MSIIQEEIAKEDEEAKNVKIIVTEMMDKQKDFKFSKVLPDHTE